MTCRQLIAFLDDYLAEALPASSRRPFEAHLEGCDDCVAYVDGYRRSIALARGALADGDGDPCDQLPEELVAAILAARRAAAGDP